MRRVALDAVLDSLLLISCELVIECHLELRAKCAIIGKLVDKGLELGNRLIV